MKETVTQVRLTEWASGAGCAAKMCARDLSDVLAPLAIPPDPNRLIGLDTADDAGVYRIAEGLALVDTADFFPPMVDDPFTFGEVAAANALSDVYAMGARPVTALNLVAFPIDQLPGQVLLDILRGGLAKLEEAGAALVGGHSIVDKEVKYGLAVTGLVDPARVVANRGAVPGDALVLSKPIGVGIVTTGIKRGGADGKAVAAAVASMTRLNRRAAELMIEAGVHACTDVTGFGLIGHGSEMARAGGVTLEIEATKVPLIPGAEALCAAGFTPGGLENNRRSFEPMTQIGAEVPAVMQDLLFDPQTSGGLLMALPEAGAEALAARLTEEQDMAAAVIGRVAAQTEGGALVVVD